MGWTIWTDRTIAQTTMRALKSSGGWHMVGVLQKASRPWGFYDAKFIQLWVNSIKIMVTIQWVCFYNVFSKHRKNWRLASLFGFTKQNVKTICCNWTEKLRRTYTFIILELPDTFTWLHKKFAVEGMQHMFLRVVNFEMNYG